MKTYSPEPKVIKFDDTTVTVKMMDDSWIIDKCVVHSPFIPKQGYAWKHEDHCSRLLIPADQYEDTMRFFRDTYGNAAVIAWDGNVVLGHVIFVPKTEARKRKMLFYERMPVSPDDDKTLVVEAVGFCSIGGQKYRKHGVGRAMAEMMIDWAIHTGWSKIEIFGVPSGLFPAHWMDSCMPPRTFWERFGFRVFEKARIYRSWEDVPDITDDDDPRHSETEKRQKQEIKVQLQQGLIAEDEWAYDYDMEKSLTVG